MSDNHQALSVREHDVVLRSKQVRLAQICYLLKEAEAPDLRGEDLGDEPFQFFSEHDRQRWSTLCRVRLYELREEFLSLSEQRSALKDKM